MLGPRLGVAHEMLKWNLKTDISPHPSITSSSKGPLAHAVIWHAQPEFIFPCKASQGSLSWPREWVQQHPEKTPKWAPSVPLPERKVWPILVQPPLQPEPKARCQTAPCPSLCLLEWGTAQHRSLLHSTRHNIQRHPKLGVVLWRLSCIQLIRIASFKPAALRNHRYSVAHEFSGMYLMGPSLNQRLPIGDNPTNTKYQKCNIAPGWK